MLSLDDDEDLIAQRPIGSVESEPRRRVSLRPLLVGVAVLGLGGALGAGAYLLSSMDTRDVIALLDVGDQPRLSLEMPRRATAKPDAKPDTPAPAAGAGPLLTPPGALSSPSPAQGEGEASGVAAMPVTPPMPAAPPSPTPADAGSEPAAGGPQPPPAIAPPVIAPPVPTGPVNAGPAPAPNPVQPLPGSAYQAPTYASLPVRQSETKPLPPAPIEGLYRQSAYGLLPVVARDGRQPWKAYARPFEAPPGKPRMAVVVAGLGLDKDATEAAIAKLPPEITLAFSPYAGGLDAWIKKARAAGHEVMVMLPAEAVGFPARDPGPWGLLVNNPVEENISRLEQVLARVPGGIGVLAPDGAFVRSPKLAPVLAALKDRGMAFVGEGAKVDADVDLPHAAVTTTLETDLFRDAIEARLNGAARTARARGTGLVVVSPRPVAFDRLLGWLDGLGEQGIVLAPASGIVKQAGKS